MEQAYSYSLMFWGFLLTQSVQQLATIIRTRPDRPWDPPNLLYNSVSVPFSGGKSGCGVALTTRPI